MISLKIQHGGASVSTRHNSAHQINISLATTAKNKVTLTLF